MKKGIFHYGENKIVERVGRDRKEIIIIDNVPNIQRYNGGYKCKCFTNKGRRFKIIYAHAGYPWLWFEVGF